MCTVTEIIDELINTHSLTIEQYRTLIESRKARTAEYLATKARKVRESVYGKDVYIRGLVEISNYCKNNCLYCGIRRDNKNCSRYRLTADEILECCDEGYDLGFRTFVLQGGEDGYYTDKILCDLISDIKSRHADCAVTLSLGERSRDSYKALRASGADRYLLRHETADSAHYSRLHPEQMSYDTRMRCLHDLRDLGFQVGCGFMVGSPYQTAENLALDLKFIEEFQPDMCGIGPFIPQQDTPFAHFDAGTVELTCYLLSVIRLIKPNILLPSTTALGSIDEYGREKGILSGANVVMPNLSPSSVRKKYALYDNKATDGAESAQSKAALQKRITSIGYSIVTARGDIKNI